MKWIKKLICDHKPVDWIEVFKNARGDYQYRIRSEANGLKLSTSETYDTKSNCREEALVQAQRHFYRYREVSE